MKPCVKYRVIGRIDYAIKVLNKHSIRIKHLRVGNDEIRFNIDVTQKQAVEKLFRDYGLKGEIVSLYDNGRNIKRLIKNWVYILGVILGFFITIFYSTLTTNFEVVGNHYVNTEIIKSVALENAQMPLYFQKPNYVKIENAILMIDGIAHVTLDKKGRTLVINIVEELPKTEIMDTDNLNIVTAKEGGKITKMVVYGGTPLVAVGDMVEKDQALIMPYVGGTENQKSTRAFGEIEAVVTRVEEISIASKNANGESAGRIIEDKINAIKGALKNGEQFLNYQISQKNVDKTIVYSIYYEIITRID